MDELRKIDLNLLLALHALLSEKHVTRAALRLHRSQPAVSPRSATPWPNCGRISTTPCWSANTAR